MTKLLPFQVRRIRSIAECLITWTASRDHLSTPKAWPPANEPLGNVLQRLALRRPLAAVALGMIASEMLAQMDRDGT